MFKEQPLFAGRKQSILQILNLGGVPSKRHGYSSRRMLEVIDVLVGEYCDWSNFAQFI